MNIKLVSSIRKKRKYAIIRWCVFCLLIWAAFIFLTSGTFMKPNLLIPLALCISMGEGELASAAVAIGCGLLSDCAFDKLTGSSAILLLIGCVCASLLFTHYLQKNFINVFLVTAIFTAFYYLIDFFFCYYIWNYSNHEIIFTDYTIISFVLTSLSLIIIYPVVKLIRKNLTLRKMHVLYENNALIKD
ncbi:MAG: hypothetical protein Q4F95_10435 [Oscillospiraceae bacterium]|nr:hypothetical protein [Oscillospiraceae bacterium]